MVVVGGSSYGSYVSTISQSSVPLRRTWTDEQLKDVVARERSWRAVAQALGLRPTSTVAVRRHAARLQLDTSHFTGQRPWSDTELMRAVRDGTSWAHVLRILGVNNNGDSMSRIRGHAARLGLEVSHLERTRGQKRAATAVAPPRSEQLRTAATSIAAAWFALRGYCTALPTEPQVYDLLVELPEGIRRIQVKSTTCRVRNGRWQVQVGRRPYAPEIPRRVHRTTRMRWITSSSLAVTARSTWFPLSCWPAGSESTSTATRTSGLGMHRACWCEHGIRRFVVSWFSWGHMA
jgi:hypothetical protein